MRIPAAPSQNHLFNALVPATYAGLLRFADRIWYRILHRIMHYVLYMPLTFSHCGVLMFYVFKASSQVLEETTNA